MEEDMNRYEEGTQRELASAKPQTLKSRRYTSAVHFKSLRNMSNEVLAKLNLHLHNLLIITYGLCTAPLQVAAREPHIPPSPIGFFFPTVVGIIIIIIISVSDLQLPAICTAQCVSVCLLHLRHGAERAAGLSVWRTVNLKKKKKSEMCLWNNPALNVYWRRRTDLAWMVWIFAHKKKKPKNFLIWTNSVFV